MRRFVWISIIIFGGGVIALMAASLLLQKQVDKPGMGAADDLHTPMLAIARALRDWQYDDLLGQTRDVHGLNQAHGTWRRELAMADVPDLPGRAWQKMFDAVNTRQAEAVRKHDTLLSALETFPSMVFTELTPIGARVQYEVELDNAAVWLRGHFVRKEDLDEEDRKGDDIKGYYLTLLRCHITDGGRTLTLTPGETPLPLAELLEKLLNSLATPTTKEFREVMEFKKDATEKQVAEKRDAIRKQVMSCGDKRLMKLVPKTGPLPKGAASFLLSTWGDVPGEAGAKRIQMGLYVSCKEPVRLIDFMAGLVPDKKPKEAE